MSNRYYEKTIHGLRIIAPTPRLLLKMGRIVQELRGMSVNDFIYVVRRLGAVFITPFDDSNDMLFVRNNIWFLDRDRLDRRKEHPSYIIGGLVHEAYHREQFLRGDMKGMRGWAGEKIERPAQKKELSFYKKHGLTASLKNRTAQFKNESKRFFEMDSTKKESDRKYERLLEAYKGGKLNITEVRTRQH